MLTARSPLLTASALALSLMAAIPLAAQLQIVTSLLPDGVISKAYPSTQLATANGTAPYTFSLSAGAWPGGLALSSTGLITGTPAGPVATVSLTIQVIDNLGATASRAYTFRIVDPPASPQWRPTGLFGGLISGIAVSPNHASDRTAFARTQNADLYRTTDGGANWTNALTNPARGYDALYDVVLSPSFLMTGSSAAQRTVFVVGFDSRIRKSADHGASFTDATAGIPAARSVFALGLSPNYAVDSTAFALAFNSNTLPHEIYRSLDGGANWTLQGTFPADTWVTPPQFYSVQASPGFPADNTLFAHVKRKLYRSTNGGATWTLVFTDPVAVNSGVTGVRISPDFTSDRAVLVETASQRIYRSTDSGVSFSDTGMLAYRLAVAQRPGLPPAWYFVRMPFSNPPYGLAWSDDYLASSAPLYGAGYPAVAATSNLTAFTAERFPGAGATPHLFMGIDNGLYQSADGGLSFQSTDRGLTAFGMGSISGAGNDLALCGTGVLMLSRDLGLHLSRRNLPGAGYYCQFAQLSPNFATDRALFVGDYSDLYRSTDGAKSFTRVFTGTPFVLVTQLVFQPGFNLTSGTAYLATDAGLFRSTNGGQSFSALTLPAACLGTGKIRGVAVSPAFATDNTLFVSTEPSGANGGLCKSVNGGSVWTQRNDGAVLIQGRIALSPVYNDSGAAGSKAKMLMAFMGGFFRRSVDGGLTWTTPSVPLSSQGGPARGTAHFSPNFVADNTVLIAAGQANGFFINSQNFGIFRSSDMGQTFTALTAPDESKSRVMNGLYLPPSFDGGATVNSPAVAAIYSAGVWRSTDGARAFNPVREYAYPEFSINALARSGGGLFLKSVDGNELAAIAPGTLLAATDDGVFQSDDGGVTYSHLSAGLPAKANTVAIAVPSGSPATPVTAVLDPSFSANQGLYRHDGTVWGKIAAGGNGDFRQLFDDGSTLYAARVGGVSLKSTDGGVNWAALQATETDLVKLDYNAQTTPTLQSGPAAKRSGLGRNAASSVTASLWAVSQLNGPRYSTDGGANWTATPGTNDYTLPAQSWSVIRALGINAASGSRDVVAGSTTGLYRSTDGGVTWRSVSGIGSGLEATSKIFSATVSATTGYGGTDILVGATGATNGGVYLSGDGGEHWTQINQGFDPNSLNISTLVKTSCSGCPVNYYTGTYGSGVYTRTIPVVAPPAVTGWYFGSTSGTCGTATNCATAGASCGPEQGGQPFKLCGSGFLALPTVEFDGVPATGCAMSTASVITCTGTPPHIPGAATVRVRNTDTRLGVMAAPYTYLAGAPRVVNSLRIAKSGINANLTWSCAGCTAGLPARVYRSQNALFTLYNENYNGGASGSWSNTGALAAGTNPSYFWNVE